MDMCLTRPPSRTFRFYGYLNGHVKYNNQSTSKTKQITASFVLVADLQKKMVSVHAKLVPFL